MKKRKGSTIGVRIESRDHDFLYDLAEFVAVDADYTYEVHAAGDGGYAFEVDAEPAAIGRMIKAIRTMRGVDIDVVLRVHKYG